MAVINGTIGNDTLPGTTADDIIHDGNGGNDTINADAGNDEITVTGGSDTVGGQSGIDRLIVDWSSVANGIQTNGFNGTFAAGYSGQYTDFSGRTVSYTGIEHFTLIGNGGNDSVTTGDGDDVATLGGGNDVANLGRGTNSGDGGAGIDGIGYDLSATSAAIVHDLNSVAGSGPGNGFINFEYFSGVIGGSGNDVFIGTNANSSDTVNGGDGDDSITVRNGSDTINGGTGSDRLTVDYSSSAAAIQTNGFNGTFATGYSGQYTDFSGRTVNFSTIEHFTFIGNAQADSVASGDGDDIVTLGQGNDVANLGGGINSGDGGLGIDGIGYNQSALAIDLTHDLTTSTYSGPGDGFTGFEYFSGVTGGSGNDVFVSTDSASSDIVNGGAGNDSITVRNGADTINGGTGSDRLIVNYSSSGASIQTSGFNGTLAAGYSGQYTDFSGRTVNYSGIENFTFIGSALNDAVASGDGDDVVMLGAGNDVANLGGGINGGDGGIGTDGIGYNLTAVAFDILHDLTSASASGPGGGFTGFEYFSNVTGGSGNDVFIGTDSNSADIVNGGAGNDSITVRNGVDTIAGGSGSDRLIVDYSGSSAGLLSNGFNGSLAAGYDGQYTNFSGRTVNFTGIENFTFIGSGVGDSATSGDGDDVVTLGNGNDVANLGGGINSGDGGAGTDGIGYNQSALTSGFSHDLTTNSYTGPGAGFSNFEYFSGVTGGSGNDVFISTDVATNDTINGGGGDDSITVRNGSDSVNGGSGSDRLIVDFSSSAGALLSNGFNGSLAAGYGGQYTDFSTRTMSFAAFEHFTLIGSAQADNVTTGDGNDIFTGNGGNDTLNAGGGDDRLTGGLGNDTLNGGAGVDTVVYAAATASVTVNLTTNTATGGDGSDTLSGIENIEGSAFADTLTGSSANNLLDGGAGDDVMTGGAGDDIYVADSIGDVVTEGAASGNDTIRAAFTIAALDVNLESIELTGSANIDGIGNASNNSITGNSGNNRLDGGAGDDVLTGGAGDDVYVIDSLGDVVTEGANAGIDRVESSVTHALGVNFEHLTLTGAANIDGSGTAGNNVITGNAGNNRIDGGLGDDSLAGGLGNDTYIVDSSGDVVTEGLNAGTDGVEASASFVLGDNIENLTLTGAASINGTGNAIGNRIIGTAGNNMLDGGAGTDTLQGLGGNDSYIVDNVNDRVVETLSLTVGDTNDAGGVDTVFASVSYSIDTASNVRFVENLTLTGVGNINATGNALANTITGNTGNNILDGGAGVDVLAGGAGNDLYLLDVAGDVVTEAAAAGTDTVRIAASYTLTANVENLQLQGSGNINGIGNGENNALTGTSGLNRLEGMGGNDVIDGGAGADTMIGGAGDDLYFIDNGSDRVFETLTNNPADTNDAGGTDTVSTSITINMNSYNGIRFVERAILTGTGSIGITGNALDNHITGNNGSNQLDGGAGADTLLGGRGNDIYIVDNLGDSISEAGGDGIDVVRSSVDWTLDLPFENLELTGSANLNGTGSALANRLTGNSGNNILDGGGGTDTLIGGAGNDTYIFDSAGDRAVETVTATVTDTNDAGGIDQIFSSFAVNLNQSNGMRFIENVTLTGTAAAAVLGNDLGNAIIANSGANMLDGANGDDIILGLGGNDTMLGRAGNDTLDGGAGRDRLTGGAGQDILTGGAEGDTFVFASGDMGTSQATADRITDWSGMAGAQGDRIDLSAIDANTANGAGTNEAFAFIGSAAFSNVAGQLRSEVIGGNSYLIADTNGDGVGDLWLRLDGTVTVGAGDLGL